MDSSQLNQLLSALDRLSECQQWEEFSKATTEADFARVDELYVTARKATRGRRARDPSINLLGAMHRNLIQSEQYRSIESKVVELWKDSGKNIEKVIPGLIALAS